MSACSTIPTPFRAYRSTLPPKYGFDWPIRYTYRKRFQVVQLEKEKGRPTIELWCWEGGARTIYVSQSDSAGPGLASTDGFCHSPYKVTYVDALPDSDRLCAFRGRVGPIAKRKFAATACEGQGPSRRHSRGPCQERGAQCPAVSAFLIWGASPAWVRTCHRARAFKKVLYRSSFNVQ